MISFTKEIELQSQERGLVTLFVGGFRLHED
jgi:hypothetical protein